MLTALEIVRYVMEELSMEPIETLVGNENPVAKQFLALMHAQGRMLLRQAPWSQLRKTHKFKTVRGKIQPEAVPEDFNHLVRDSRFPKIYTISHNLFRAHQDLIEDESIQYDYISSNWIEDKNGARKNKITADSDKILFDEAIMIQGLKWQFLKEKGLDYYTDQDIFQRLISSVIAQHNAASNAAPIISLAQ